MLRLLFTMLFMFSFTLFANTTKTPQTETKPTNTASTNTEKKATVNIIKSHGFTILGGPLKYAKDFKQFDYVNPSAPKGGKLKLHEVGTFDNLNPYILKGRPGASTTMVFESLMTGSADEMDSFYGLIAETVEYPEDKSWLIFHLRKNAHWHDGTPITSQDVIFSREILLQHGYPSYRDLLNMITEIQAIDAHTVKFIFDKKHLDNRDLFAIPASMPVLPKAYYDKHEFDKTTLEPPLGSGPYKITKVDAGHSITYERVKDYWAKDLNVNIGTYNFDAIQIDYYRDGQVAFEAFKSGQYDIVQEMASKRWATEYDFPAIKKGEVIISEINHENPVGLQAVFMNLRRDKFKDIKVRKALTLAFDFEWLNKTQFYDSYERTTSAFQNTPMAAVHPPTQSELELLKPHKAKLPDEIFTQAFSLPVNDGSGRIRKTLSQASKLLDEAGWRVNREGIRTNAKGEPLTMEMLIFKPYFQKIYQPYIDNLTKLGIKAELKMVDVTQFHNRRRSFDFDLLPLRWGGSLIPGLEQHLRWHSKEAANEGSPNLSGVQNPMIDTLLEKLTAAKTIEDITLISKAMDRVIMWHYYFIPMYYKATYRIAYWNKVVPPAIEPPYVNMVGGTIGEPIGSAHLWWYKKK